MNLLRNFLINTIYVFKTIVKSLTYKPDYKIIERQLEYWVEHDKEYMTNDEFWENQSWGWDKHTDSYVTNFDAEGVPPPPDVVTKLIIRIKYWYNNRVYKYITYDHNYTWPPDVPNGVHFSIPLTSAKLLNSNGEPVKDLLGKIKRYAGPRGCFYNTKIKIADMFYYDEDTLKNTYPKIELKNIFGLTKIVSTSDGYIKDLTIP